MLEHFALVILAGTFIAAGARGFEEWAHRRDVEAWLHTDDGRRCWYRATATHEAAHRELSDGR